MKTYKREGRKFIPIEDVTDSFLQKDGTWSLVKNKDTVGLCVLQTAKYRKVAIISTMHIGNWKNCLLWCNSQLVNNIQAHTPKRWEMYLLKEYNYRLHLPTGLYWTSEEVSFDFAWTLDLGWYDTFGYCGSNGKNGDHNVLAFVDIPL